MSDKLNGYQLSRNWFNFSFENPDLVRPIHTAVFMWAIERCNRLGWKEKFGFPTSQAMEAIGVKSKNTYLKALNDLVDWGFVKMVQESKNQWSANIIAISKIDTATNTALDMATIQHDAQQVNATDTIDKPINQEPINHKPYTDEFEEFWELYDLKKGKKRAWQKWKNLSKEDHENIMENVPIFLTHFSSKEYTPRPRKYLVNEYWEDEGYQQPKQEPNGHNRSNVRKTKGDRRAEILEQDLTGDWIS